MVPDYDEIRRNIDDHAWTRQVLSAWLGQDFKLIRKRFFVDTLDGQPGDPVIDEKFVERWLCLSRSETTRREDGYPHEIIIDWTEEGFFESGRPGLLHGRSLSAYLKNGIFRHSTYWELVQEFDSQAFEALFSRCRLARLLAARLDPFRDLRDAASPQNGSVTENAMER